MKARKVTKVEYEALAALRYALRQFLRFSEDAAREVGLRPQQHQALLAIKGFPGRDRVSVGELAERLQIRHHSAVGLAARLARKHLIAHRQNPSDRRQAQLSLTPAGERLLRKLSAAHREQLRRLGPHIEALLKRLRGPRSTGGIFH